MPNHTLNHKLHPQITNHFN